jgi:ABC-type lipoprotein export system ATPase subunit
VPTDVMRAARPLVATGVVYELSDGRRVLDDVTFALAPGTMTALTGPSGAGKSTLLWILAGALAPTSGTVTYAAAPVGDRVAAARAGIVLVPQGVALVTALTARENLVVPLLMHGVGAGEAHARADAALASVLLAESGNHLVEELSGGEQQRVGVARALGVATQRAARGRADERVGRGDPRDDRGVVARGGRRGGGRACWRRMTRGALIRRTRSITSTRDRCGGFDDHLTSQGEARG